MPGFSYPGTPGVVANEGRLFEPYRQIVPRKICRLAEPITVIAVACDVEFDAADFSEFGKIPFLPIDDAAATLPLDGNVIHCIIRRQRVTVTVIGAASLVQPKRNDRPQFVHVFVMASGVAKIIVMVLISLPLASNPVA